MMVTFVSQCQKNSLKKTRRVLDAFADRIGDNTWQTIITEDGLIVVKKMLRQTASKNTAVSCHWIRGRSRSELLWVVGNKSQFDEVGRVPVNSTEKEVFMDVQTDKPKAGFLYANTHLQSLAEHLFAVGYVAEQLLKQLMPNRDELERFAFINFVAGCLHDIGKADPTFQDWVKNPKKKKFVAEDGQHIDDTKFSFEKYPRHNEVSVLIYHLLDSKQRELVNGQGVSTIKHAVYWHHAKPYRKEKGDFEKYGDIYKKLDSNIGESDFPDFFNKAISLMLKVADLDKSYRGSSFSNIEKIISDKIDTSAMETIGGLDLPKYKEYDSKEVVKKYITDIKKNAINNIARVCVISADRVVSSWSATELSEKIRQCELDQMVDDMLNVDSTLHSHIQHCLGLFPLDDRSKKQNEVAIKLANIGGVAVLSGAAGCGKTKIALEWAGIKNAKQIIWVCPRVQICQGLFIELTSEQYLPDANIEINTGEFKFLNEWDSPLTEDQYFSSDVVITTIDQILGSIISHTKANTLIDFLNAHIVFDEYHEYVNMPSFNLLFAELVACKNFNNGDANTLLVSATPHYYFVENVLDIHLDDVIEMPSFNTSRYRLEFRDYDETVQDSTNPLFSPRSENTFVISNTAITAQKSFIANQKIEKSVLIHSKFKKSDKKYLFKEVFDSFSKEGTGKYEVLRAGPIVQASLNISCDAMISELTCPEDFLQRLGRLDRFGKNSDVNVYTIAVPRPIADRKGKSNSITFMRRMFILETVKAWHNYLSDSSVVNEFTLPDIYALYKKFYESNVGIKAIEGDLVSALKESVVQMSAKVIDPIKIQKPPIDANKRRKISKNSLRGNNRFVQLAVCDVNDCNNPRFNNEYAYYEPLDDISEIDNLTESVEVIEGYGDSTKSLLAHMANKHHNIKGGAKAYKDFILLNEARDPEFPVYLSYTTEDLEKVGGESARHSYAIYYAVTDKQPVGAISIKQLISNEE
jgi:CRISPR-associated endonuclease/helicase Cas3